MTTLLIVYHSMTGGTLQMAQAACRGATAEAGLRVVLRKARDTHSADVLAANALLFACPENLAAMSGQMKDFFDRTYYDVIDHVDGKPFAQMICAGSDGRNAAQQIDRIAAGWRLKPIAPALIVCTCAQTPEDILRPKQIGAADLKLCEELAATLACGLALGLF